MQKIKSQVAIICFLISHLLLSLAVTTTATAAPLPGFQLDGQRWSYREGEQTLAGILVKPEGDGPFPAIIISHGLGGNAQGFGAQAAREFVKRGFVCIATDYTHNSEAARSRQQQPLRGPGFPPGRQGSPHPANFGASPENLKRALKCIEILESLPFVDSKRIAAYGHSMGAFLTIALAAEASDRIRAVAITAGGLSGRPGFPAPTAEVAAKIRVPFLILHGSADTTVRPQQSEALKAELDRHKVPNERHVFEGENHGIDRSKREECFRLMNDWFSRHGVLTHEQTKSGSN